MPCQYFSLTFSRLDLDTPPRLAPLHGATMEVHPCHAPTPPTPSSCATSSYDPTPTAHRGYTGPTTSASRPVPSTSMRCCSTFLRTRPSASWRAAPPMASPGSSPTTALATSMASAPASPPSASSPSSTWVRTATTAHSSRSESRSPTAAPPGTSEAVVTLSAGVAFGSIRPVAIDLAPTVGPLSIATNPTQIPGAAVVRTGGCRQVRIEFAFVSAPGQAVTL